MSQFDSQMPDSVEPLDDDALRLLLELDEALRSGSTTGESATLSSLGESKADQQVITSAALCLMELESVFPRTGRMKGLDQDSQDFPKSIGRFQIAGVLGAGGFGIVYRGHDPDLNRAVAIKLPRQSFATSELRKRFMREAHATAQLDHPHIVPIYEAGEIDSQPFIAYAYCDGPTLARWCSEQAELMLPRQAVQLMIPLTEAIAYSHSRGILHRDIKPSNVLLFPRTQPSGDMFPFVAKLSDLGLAKFIESRVDETASAMILGTPTFMSPEQASGGDVGATTDVYSLGATLYFLLTGRPPFVANKLPELLKQLLELDPLEPTTLNPNVDAELNTICMKCLDKQPARRYMTAQDLVDDLRRFQSGVPIHARPITSLHRVVRWSRRKPAIALLASSVCLLATVLMATLSIYSLKLSTLSHELKDRNGELLETVERLDASLKSAEEHRRVAEASDRETRQLLYVEDVQAAGEAWNKRDYRTARKMLTRHAYSTPMQEYASRFLSTRLSTQFTDSLELGAQIWNISLGHDGRRLAVGDARGKIHLVQLGEHMSLDRSWDSGQGEINSVAFSSDDKLLASAGDDGRVGIWDSSSGQHVRWLEAFKDKPVFGVEFTSNGKRLVACGNTPELLVWDCDNFELIHRTKTDHHKGIEALSLSPDGRCVSTVGHDGFVRVHEIDGMQLLKELQTPERAVVVRYDASGDVLFTGDRGNNLIAWSASTGEQLDRYRTADPILALSVNLDGDVCVTDAGGVMHLLAIEQSNFRLKRVYIGDDDRLAAICTRTDARVFITGGSQQKLKQWKFDSLPVEVRVRRMPGEHFHDSFELPVDGMSVMCIGERELSQFDIFTGKRKQSWKFNIDINACSLSRDQQYLAVSDLQGRVALVEWHDLNQTSQSVVWQTVYEGSKADCLYLMRDGRHVIVANANGDIRVRDMLGNRTVASFDNRGIFDTSPDERWLASGKGGTNELEIIDTRSWQTEIVRPAHTASVWETRFSHDGKWLVTTSGDRTAKVWSVDDWTIRTSLEGHDQAIHHATVSPDNQTIVTVDLADKVIFWHAASGQKLLELDQPLQDIVFAEFSADGQRLVLGSHAGAIDIIYAE